MTRQSRFAKAGLCLAWLVMGVLAGCSSSPERPVAAPPPVPSAAVINAPRSDRGNPPFYEVFGQRYYVLASGDGYRANGVASWYGRDFHGQQTSSGEKYDMYAYTAAHKTLPIPTWVEVTNRRNGRSVIVKVNDRGPFVDDRIIDLSYAAALELDMIRDGTAPVTVRALGAPAAAPRPVETTAARADPPPQRGGFSIISSAAAAEIEPARIERQHYLQAGAFSVAGNADKLAKRLRRSGFSNTFVIPDNESASGLNLVRVGPLADEAEIDSVSNRLNAIGIDARLVLEP